MRYGKKKNARRPYGRLHVGLFSPPLSSFTNVYCLCNAVIIFTQGRGRSEVETQPSWERTNSDGGLETDSCRGEKSRRDPGSEVRIHQTHNEIGGRFRDAAR